MRSPAPSAPNPLGTMVHGLARSRSALFRSALFRSAVFGAAAIGAAVVGPAQAGAQEPDPPPLARAAVRGASTVVVGQPVTVDVEVLVPSFFRGAPQYERIDPDGAIAVFNPRGTNFVERDGGRTWAGQRRSYTIYPNRVGTYDLDPIAVEIRHGGTTGQATDTVLTGPVTFEAIIPEAARGLDVFVAATDVRMEQVVDPPPDTIRVGDAFSRVITTDVGGTLSLVVPPLAFDSVEGLAVYPAPPALSDTGGARGTGVTGTRVESVTYVAQTEGAYSLPPVTLDWWDWSDEVLRHAAVPGLRFVVVANPDLQAEIELPPDSLDVADAGAADRTEVTLTGAMRRWAMGVAGVALFVLVAWRLVGPRISGWRVAMDAARAARAESESAHFDRLLRAARSDDAPGTANALGLWLTAFEPTRAEPTAAHLMKLANDPALTSKLEALDALLFGSGGDSPWSGRRLADRLSAARSRLAAQEGRLARTGPLRRTPQGLAPLNP